MQKLIKYLAETINEFTKLNVVKKVIVICCFFVFLLTFGIVVNWVKSKFDSNYIKPIEKVKIDSLKIIYTENDIKRIKKRLNGADSVAIADSILRANGIYQ